MREHGSHRETYRHVDSASGFLLQKIGRPVNPADAQRGLKRPRVSEQHPRRGRIAGAERAVNFQPFQPEASDDLPSMLSQLPNRFEWKRDPVF